MVSCRNLDKVKGMTRVNFESEVDTRSQHVQLVHLSELGITSCCSSFYRM
jgi:hypothetical protein